jgi:hypothetical protein
VAPGPGDLWDSVRAWADAAGLLLPQDPEANARPKVPQAVCDNCPICQGAATLDQVNPDVVHELAELARTVMVGFGSALGSAAEQRLARPASGSVAAQAAAASGEDAAGGAEDGTDRREDESPDDDAW